MSDRPLSPHLQIYKVQVTSFFSIMHRLTGILLFLLLMILSWCFILYVYFPKLFIVKYLNVLLFTPIAKLAYVLYFISFLYHFLNGIRHLLWDAGLNLEIASVSKSAMLLTVTLLLSTMAFLFMLI
ncbi:succinate dehydrogenase, cytochrome b556 subunit [Wolbachia endosymbiont of Armadillidium vulgare str. wVulC]|uniref:Succinate dehydrogenase cytochrome b556 subunit n=1 Tax=Wolbachia endosymbiont of Armadillidium arcangelii TaxID=3158571 RepID=A0AAU7Q2V0_9RICK|nr:succinate dehydrogenase, cytochrome b556 subunit [Wolbachia endosymbiont of Armadillidium vulgare]KLT22260.1 succinate dehydrogenase, cytochrome b556 subunit [Wolbachia endosymbiont of Armadillidium vulgare str. wVulC]OJH30432.1 Succinate dehydrogenase cytochrome b556 subunit [Armadillidium vulgare] [Wolbachia endosymbiont of Armadillidium vulgare]OJH32168.1 Succinate dehydrogenase cytochrome b556 subunit [Wolbachia endosymbiont of Armadillidium vulgare]OJH33035.1 Succinate dehydrogenase cyt